MARYLMIPYASRYEVGDSKDAAKKLFDTMMQDCAETTTGVENIPPDVREGAYCSAIKFGPQANFDFLLKLYHQQVKYQYYFYQEYHAMLAGLACTTSKENLKGLIPVVLNANTPEAAYRPLMYLTRNPIASDVMMEYIRSNAKQVLESGQIDLYLQSMTAAWQTQTRLDQFIQLCNDLERGDPQVPASVCAPHIASLRAQVSRAQRYLPDIGAF
ncbi:unnamed protein product [Anisakis simplex]|uniref:ERAP1_C domain-containing protein n=1 Tax=Anisakis simplex TaxID=6269 RepID=A0A0M3J726_ANISI|nr:unnamed protein product [Anisakis simplex]